MFAGGKGLLQEHQTPKTRFMFKSSSTLFLPLSLLLPEEILQKPDLPVIHMARLRHPRMTSSRSLSPPSGLPLNVLAMHYILKVTENCHFASSVLSGFPSLFHSRSLIHTFIFPKGAASHSYRFGGDTYLGKR